MNQTVPMKHVLFVCVENSCRSQMAEAFGHIHNDGQLAIFSSGSRPSGLVNPKAGATMKERGYDMDPHYSKSFSEVPSLEYDAVGTRGGGDECPEIRSQLREDWGLPDPKHMAEDQFRKIRDLIEVKVQDLFQRLA